jgi:hypothetical protein
MSSAIAANTCRASNASSVPTRPVISTSGIVIPIATIQTRPSGPKRRRASQLSRNSVPRVAAAACSRAVHARGPNALNRADWIQCTSGGLTSRGSPPKCGTTRSPVRNISTEVRANRLSSGSSNGTAPAFKSNSRAAPANTIQKAWRGLMVTFFSDPPDRNK